MKEMSFEEFAAKWGPRFGTKGALWLADYQLDFIWSRLWFIISGQLSNLSDDYSPL